MLWTLKTDDCATLAAFAPGDCDELALTVEAAAAPAAEAALAAWPREKIRLCLPMITRAAAGDGAALRERLRAAVAAGHSRWEISQLGQLEVLRECGAATDDVTADWPLYVMNRDAAAMLFAQGLGRVTASPEDCRENLRALLPALGARLQVILYQDTPLFTAEACPKSALWRFKAAPGGGRDGEKSGEQGAGHCACDGAPARLVNGRGQEYLALSRRCRTTVISAEPYCVSGFLEELRSFGLAAARVDFVNRAYASAAARAVWDAARAGRPVPGAHDGNYLRGLR